MQGPAFAHNVEAQCRVGHLRADIECVRHGLERGHILGKGFPVEAHTFGQDGAGNILDAFHQVDQEIAGAGPHGGETYPAVPDYHRRHTVQRRGGQLCVPGGLAVVVGVDIDKARGDDHALRIELAPSGADIIADGADAAACKGNIGTAAIAARTVDHGALAYYEIMHEASPVRLKDGCADCFRGSAAETSPPS